MRIITLTCFFCGVIISINQLYAQTDYAQNQPAIGLGVTTNDGAYVFTHEGKKVGHYAIGWYSDSQVAGAPMAYITGYGGIRFFTRGGHTRLFISNNGNVGIGTSIPQAKLAVEGNILAREVKVKTDISVPDYVFGPEYELQPLTEVEAYVKEHRHLPEIPPAKDIERDGLDLAEMNLLLLKKVEELTLHLIEKEKQIELIIEELAILRKN